MFIAAQKPLARAARSAVALFTAAALLVTSACSTAPRDVRFANVDGQRVAYRVTGSSGPAVVLISGLGDGLDTFDEVAVELAAFATVIVYDRSGYGGSGMRDGAHDAAAADRELSGLLAQTGVPGPYVLVGHSIGGLFAEYYAANHPEQIAGLILEDSRPYDFQEMCEAAGVQMCVAPAVAMLLAPKGAQRELEALPPTNAQVRDMGAVRGKPVLVLSQRAATGSGSFEAAWTEGQNRLAARYENARHSFGEGGHYLHDEQKAWFVNSVRDFLAQLRERGGRRVPSQSMS